MHSNYRPLGAAALVALGLALGGPVQAEDISWVLRAQGLGRWQSVRDGSPFNPGNRLAGLEDARLLLEARPDVFYDGAAIQAMVKPRIQLSWEAVEVAGERRTGSDAEAFINEWRLRFAPAETLFVSYGREVLLWGPAMFFSPSNPFFIDNGRSNPFEELPGRDFLQFQYLPDFSWTISYLGNLDPGRAAAVGFAPFKETHALKLDYVGFAHSAGVILSHVRDGPNRFGGYLQLTVSDALLAYFEGSFGEGSEALYPLATDQAPGWTLAPLRRDEGRILGTYLLGGAYTFESGPTLTLEYLRNEAGYDSRAANDFYAMADDLARAFAEGGEAGGRAARLLGQAVTPLPLLRRDYLFAQWLNTGIRDQLDITLRLTLNLNDGGSRFVPVMEWAVSDSTRLFSLGVFNWGGGDTEFSRYQRYQVLFGLNHTFD